MKNILIISTNKDNYLHMTYKGGHSGGSVAILDKRLLTEEQIESVLHIGSVAVEDIDYLTLRDGSIDAVSSKLEVLKRYA